ncbi:hypothetical protein KAV46_02475 [Candidatus Bathyarchaeota archaeon]|nr:hypothetical protein [Candidatus Bathyarchaeota archaeon]MCK4399825.1 hypothetical protein [Candidatus Bathyarchaeota archaeon]
MSSLRPSPNPVLGRQLWLRRGHTLREPMHPIIIVRHGEAEHNVGDLTGGWSASTTPPPSGTWVESSRYPPRLWIP